MVADYCEVGKRASAGIVQRVMRPVTAALCVTDRYPKRMTPLSRMTVHVEKEKLDAERQTNRKEAIPLNRDRVVARVDTR